MKNRLKVARAEMDLTQEELAKRIGVSRQSINAIHGLSLEDGAGVRETGGGDFLFGG